MAPTAGGGNPTPALGVVPPPGAGVLPGVPGVDPTAGPAIPADAPPFAAPGIPGLTPPMGAPMGGVPGLPGLGADIAPPAFVQEQQAQEAARQRAAAERAKQQAIAQAAAADPFASAYAAPAAGPQEVRLVIDDKPVDDKEVGRNKTGSLIALVATAVVCIGIGAGVGNLVSSNSANASALRAVTDIRGEVTRVATLVNTAKEKIDHAAEAGNIRVQREGDEGQAPAAPTHPPTVDEEFIAWIREQPPEPPFSPAIFAGRAGRLNPNLVGKLTLTALQVAKLWDELLTHGRRTNVPAVRESINSLNPATSPLARTYVVFVPNGQSVAATLALASGTPDAATGNIAFPAAGANQPALTRQLFTGAAPLMPSAIPSAAITLRPTPELLAAGAGRWRDYQERIRDLKATAEELSQTIEQLQQLLSPGAAGGGH